VSAEPIDVQVAPEAAPKAFLEVRNLRVHFPTEDGLVKSVDDLSFSLERGRRLVSDQHLGSGRQSHRDHHALAHAAGELVRVVRQPPVAEAHQVEQLGGALGGGTARGVAALGQDFAELVADRVDRIERAHGALRHIGDVAPARPSRCRLVHRLAFEYDAPAGQLSVLGQHAHDGAHRRGLAAARFAHQADDPSLGDSE